MSACRQCAAREQRGAVLVFFALFAPVAVLFLSFVIDVGNWFDHARHLQLQADAGALASAQGFQPCNDTAIYSAAGQYSGASSVTTPTGGFAAAGSPLYNQQLGGTTQANIHELIDSPTYYNQPSPVDSTVNTSDPCTAEMVDVKVTETNLPWYFRLLSVPYINAHARVKILERTTATGSLPVAVNDLNPKSIEAYFVNEATGEQLSAGGKLAAVALQHIKANGALAEWSSNEVEPYGLEVTKPGIGVRIAISGRSSLTGNMSTDCSQSLVICYDTTSSSVGILHIRGYQGTGKGSAASPIVRSVTLSPNTCSDGYFSDPASSCTIGVKAVVNFGTSTRPANAEVDAVNHGTGTCYALTYQSTSSTTLDETWSSASGVPSPNCSGFKNNQKAGTGYVTLAAGAGSTQIDLQVADSSATKTCSNTPSLCNVQRSYTADLPAGPIHSGPIQAAFLSQGGVPGADSFAMCESGVTACTDKLVVTIDISGNLQDAQSVSDPVYEMRLSETGSQNQSVECTPAQGQPTYANMLASGCAGPYGINATLTCPDSNTPIDCVKPATGEKINQVGKGMNLRILGSEKPATCTSPNHWKEFTFTNGVPNVSPSDPRVVTVFITPYGSFGGSGKPAEFPIADFATFYVTGWRGSKGEGFSNPCQGNGDDPAKESTIVGHFIKYVETLAPTGSGGSTCEVNSLNECIAVLTN
jgi:Flp pilus assembly protein TadG